MKPMHTPSFPEFSRRRFVASCADELCLVRSMHTDNNNHPFALNTLHLRQHHGEDVLEAARLLDLTGESAATPKL
jgi:hypothetical protein